MPKEINIGCKNADPDLFRVISVFQTFLKAKQVQFEIEELRVSTAFVYFVKVLNTNLEGHIGRHGKTNKIVYVIKDAGRMNWALKEGFTQTQAFEDVGVLKEAVSIDSFIKWITGEPSYKLRGEYIIAAATKRIEQPKDK